ncbi:hypothetical protein L596_013494 [Steinernema carpocapsae]|uniref:Uncharacterized protein n=1 Tax=Steinernema carpocapsae TaxID=34508 RepID=A0A4U5P173_STECR|nr:hypothetical protein L596_013494 [Steinernema carpocapsae]
MDDTCNKTQEQITDLVNGRLTCNKTGLPDDFYCKGSCLLYLTDWHTFSTKWEPISSFKPTCDVVEVKCGTDSTNVSDYQTVHTQLVERPNKFDYGSHQKNTNAVPEWKSASQAERPNI